MEQLPENMIPEVYGEGRIPYEKDAFFCYSCFHWSDIEDFNNQNLCPFCGCPVLKRHTGKYDK